MAPKGMKRAASRSAGGALKKAAVATGVASKCRVVASSIREASHVPAAVRSMMCDMLGRTFSTYKEERHPFQVTISDLVGKTLNEVQGNLQTAINEAQASKAALEADAAPLFQANDAAVSTHDAASKALADSKTALAESKAALREAKSTLHDTEAAAKTAEAESAATASKKAKLESLVSETIAQVRDGIQHGATVGRHVGSIAGHCVEPEFSKHVVQTFSKKSSSWGTFDRIVDKRLEAQIAKNVEGLSAELQQIAAAQATRASDIESQKAAVVAADERIKAADEACNAAAAAAKESDTAAKAAAAGLREKQQVIAKAAQACTHADDAMAAFTNEPLAAYTEVEARSAPPPPPVEEPAAPALEEAMMPTPSAGSQPAAATAPSSPRVLLNRAVSAVQGLAGSSPRVA